MLYKTCSLLCLLVVIGCNPKKAGTGQVVTVTGSVSSAKMGITLIHEHVLVDFIGADSTGYHRWDRDQVVKKVLPYLEKVKSKGVKTVLECTPAYLGRDPQILKTLSQKSGLNILTNTGFYGAVHDKYLPEYVFEISVDSIARIWIDEFENGIEDTGIYPSFIKISVDSDSVLSSVDEKLVLAALETHRQTGLTIVSHTGPDGPALAQLELIRKSDVSPTAWVWTHAQGGTTATHIQAAKQGAWISLDNVNKANMEPYITQLVNLKEAKLLSNVLISHDAGYYDPDKANGGDFRGYTDIFTHFIPALQENGFTQAEIDQLLIENPREAYQIRVRMK